MTFDHLLNLIHESSEEFNPKLFDILKNSPDPLIGVHFSEGIPKNREPKDTSPFLATRLTPGHHDPLGTYVFPKEYVLNNLLFKNTGFANKKYAYIIKPSNKANILNLNMSEEEARKILFSMGISDEYYDDPDLYHRSVSDDKLTPGHKFWASIESYRHKNNLSKNNSWNILFNKTPYNAIYDPGLAIVHSNEPIQIVYLKKDAFEVVDVINQNPSQNIINIFKKEFPNFKITEEKSRYDNNRKIVFSDKNNYFYLYFDANNFDISVMVNNEHRLKFTKDSSKTGWGIAGEYFRDLNSLINAIKQKFNPKEEVEQKTNNIIKDIANLYGLRLEKNDYEGYMIVRNYSHEESKIYFNIFGSDYNDTLTINIKKSLKNKSKYSNAYNSYHFNSAIEIDYRKSSQTLLNELFDKIFEEINAQKDNSEKRLKENQKKQRIDHYLYDDVTRCRNALNDLKIIRKKTFPENPTRNLKKV
jgi:hypothetical protein